MTARRNRRTIRCYSITVIYGGVVIVESRESAVSPQAAADAVLMAGKFRDGVYVHVYGFGRPPRYVTRHYVYRVTGVWAIRHYPPALGTQGIASEGASV